MNTKDKELLILGILRSHQSHGYELNSLLESPSMPIQIGKANAYQILNRFSERGWAKSTEEREGSRPARSVYAITEDGEATFQHLLRERIAAHGPPSHADAVALNFLDILPKREAVELLSQRLEAMERQLNEMREMTAAGTGVHYGMDFMLKYAEFEYCWTQELIAKLTANL